MLTEAQKLAKRKYVQKYPERVRAAKAAYRDRNREALKAKKREYNILAKVKRSEYAKASRTLIGATQRKWRNSNSPAAFRYNLSLSLRSRLHMAIKGSAKTGSAVRDLGCSIPELKLYLEKQFKPGMTWENRSKAGWHIDHIMPLASFDLTNRDELLKAVHYTNLQPLWAEENIKKSDKL